LQETFKLRKFGSGDLEQVVHINRLCLPENYTNYFFTELHRRFPATFLVAEENGEIVGYVMCRIETGLSGFRGIIKKGHVVSIAVLPKHQHKGIGRALMIKVMENMELYNAKICFLEVRVSNKAAVNLYKNLGFKVSRVIRNYYVDREDAYVMSRELPFGLRV
jgi:ribosomal-protein-alanine N-acetyltransferase